MGVSTVKEEQKGLCCFLLPAAHRNLAPAACQAAWLRMKRKKKKKMMDLEVARD